MSVLIARGANSARRMGRVMVGAGSTSGKITDVGPLDRLHGLRWSRRRVLRWNHCEISVLTFPTAAVAPFPGLGRFRIGDGGWFDSGLKGWDKRLGFKVSVIVVTSSYETISPFVICRHCCTGDDDLDF